MRRPGARGKLFAAFALMAIVLSLLGAHVLATDATPVPPTPENPTPSEPADFSLAAIEPPVVLINGAAQSVTVPVGSTVYFSYSGNAEAATWGNGQCSGAPQNPGWGANPYEMISSIAWVLSIQARLPDHPEIVSPCLSITFASPNPTPGPTSTPLPTSTPVPTPTPTQPASNITLNNQPNSITLQTTLPVVVSASGLTIEIFDGASCSGSPIATSFTFVVRTRETGGQESYRARDQLHSGPYGPCLTATWIDPPVMMLNGAASNVSAPVGQGIFFEASEGAEWTYWHDVTCGSASPAMAWSPTRFSMARGSAGTTWFQARWIAHPDIVSPCLSATWIAPTPTPTPIPTNTPTSVPTSTPTPVPTNTPTPEPTSTPTPQPTETPTPEPTATATPEPTSTPTIAPTSTPTPTATATALPTNTPTPEPTPSPTQTPEPTNTPTPEPTLTPTPVPTETPTPEPTLTPTPLPTETPTPAPTLTPTPLPTETPTPAPTLTPTPTATATPEPTMTPTPEPTETPTPEPTATPTAEPTSTTTPEATATEEPSATPTVEPTNSPTPTETATPAPTETATPEPTSTPGLSTPTATATPAEGTIVVELSTADGNALPGSTTVCLNAICQREDQFRTASIGDRVFVFTAAPGNYSLTVRNADPYADLATTVTVRRGEAVTVPITLTRSATPTPGATETAAPKPTDQAPPITDLPNTGGPGAVADSIWNTALTGIGFALMLLGCALLIRHRRIRA